ncbi:hypothetical protein Bca4012_046030 [Brassica carinata]
MLKRPFKVAATAKLPTFLPRDVERIKDTFALNREASRKTARMGVKQALRSIDAFPRAE